MTFDAHDVGTSVDAWRTSELFRRAQPVDASRFSSLVVAAAHPDDETLSSGGLISRFAASGRPVTIVLASRGEASHPDSTTTTPAALAERREAEFARAIAAMAPDAETVVMGLPDGGLSTNIEAIGQALVAALAPGALLISTWEGDAHPDHEAVARAAIVAGRSEGVEHWQAPIWAWHWGQPADTGEWPAAVRIALTPDERRRKREAAAHHVSQITPLGPLIGDEQLLDATFLAHFEGDTEIYFRAAATPAAPTSDRLGRGFFDEFYSDGDDPWGFETRWYEQRKRDIMLAMLPRPRFGVALELGCSIGVTSAALAERTDSLLALDIAEAPLERARERLGDEPTVRFERRTLPEEWPDGEFDLIVVSEVGYYLDSAALDDLIRRCVGATSAEGVVVACHWRHPVDEYPLAGDAVHEAFRASGLALVAEHLEADFRIDVFNRTGHSVAHETGLV